LSKICYAFVTVVTWETGCAVIATVTAPQKQRSRRECFKKLQKSAIFLPIYSVLAEIGAISSDAAPTQGIAAFGTAKL